MKRRNFLGLMAAAVAALAVPVKATHAVPKLASSAWIDAFDQGVRRGLVEGLCLLEDRRIMAEWRMACAA